MHAAGPVTSLCSVTPSTTPRAPTSPPHPSATAAVCSTTEDLVARVKEITGGRGADAAVDSVAGAPRPDAHRSPVLAQTAAPAGFHPPSLTVPSPCPPASPRSQPHPTPHTPGPLSEKLGDAMRTGGQVLIYGLMVGCLGGRGGKGASLAALARARASFWLACAAGMLHTCAGGEAQTRPNAAAAAAAARTLAGGRDVPGRRAGVPL
jgi:hypothetical protein